MKNFKFILNLQIFLKTKIFLLLSNLIFCEGGMTRDGCETKEESKKARRVARREIKTCIETHARERDVAPKEKEPRTKERERTRVRLAHACPNIVKEARRLEQQTRSESAQCLGLGHSVCE